VKEYFKLSNLLFYLLITFIAFFLGMLFAGITGAGKGQGLAGGAIVFGYGVISAGVSFVISIFLAQWFGSVIVIRLNKIMLVIVVVMMALLFYRYQTRHVANNQSLAPNINHLVPTAQAANYRAGKPALVRPTLNKSVLGLGMVSPNIYENKDVLFYGNPNLEKAVSDHMPTDRLIFKRSETGISIKYAPPWFVPAHMKMDYEILKLRLISISNDFIEVVVNERTGQKAYMDRSKNKLLFWPEFLLSVSSVEPVSREKNPVRIKPLSHAGLVTKQYAFLKPLRVKREWMRVELLSDDFKSLGKGWIQWQENGKLLIKYSLLS